VSVREKDVLDLRDDGLAICLDRYAQVDNQLKAAIDGGDDLLPKYGGSVLAVIVFTATCTYFEAEIDPKLGADNRGQSDAGGDLELGHEFDDELKHRAQAGFDRDIDRDVGGDLGSWNDVSMSAARREIK
jgi:hypothetical protein